MSEEKSLISASSAGLTPAKFDNKAFKEASKAGDYLGRLQLMTGGTKEVKAEQFPANHFAHIKDKNLEDLGDSVDVVVVAWRPKALDMNDGVAEVFDQESSEFQRIEKQASVKDSNCMYGPEYLCWVPSINTFAVFYMGTASARRESPNMQARLEKGATLGKQFIETKNFSWWAPKITPCNEDLSPLPDADLLKKWWEKFNNPVTDDREKVEETSGGREV
jgi:hypothetical protein